MKVLGMMSGTSCDGLDFSCIEFDSPTSWKTLWTRTEKYPKPLRDKVLTLQTPGTKSTLKHFLECDRDLGEWYGKAATAAMQKNTPADLIACHGQTVSHFPSNKRMGTTLQLGDPTRISFHTGTSVVSHFRQGDMAAGGQGAPLVPIFHKMLLQKNSLIGKAAIHNLGGISNLSFFTSAGDSLGFDTGPANIWIDAAVSRVTRGKKSFDSGGALAAKGRVDENAVQRILKNPFFKKNPPKSTGRDDFPFRNLLRVTQAKGADLVATATAVTAKSIAQAYRTWVQPIAPLQSIYFAGGGSKNHTLLEMISEELPNISISTVSDLGSDPNYLEAEAFALLGFLTLQGKPLGGKWTGVADFGPPGMITPGKNWAELFLDKS